MPAIIKFFSEVVFAIPFAFAGIWLMGALLFVGLILPYLFFVSSGFGFFSTLVYGTSINALMLANYAAMEFLIENRLLDIDKMMRNAVIECILLFVLAWGYSVGFTW